MVVDATDARFQVLEGRVSRLEEKVDRIETSLIRLEPKITEILPTGAKVSDLHEPQVELAELKGRVLALPT